MSILDLFKKKTEDESLVQKLGNFLRGMKEAPASPWSIKEKLKPTVEKVEASKFGRVSKATEELLPWKVGTKIANIGSSYLGGILSGSKIREPTATISELVSPGLKNVGALLKGQESKSAFKEVPKALGVAGPLGFAIGAAAEIGVPELTDIGKLGKLAKDSKFFDAEKLSDLFKNSFKTNPQDALLKANRLKGEKLSFSEALTGLGTKGEDIPGRIKFRLDDLGEPIIEDGRHLLEAYRRLGKEVPVNKIDMASLKEVLTKATPAKETIDTIVKTDPVQKIVKLIKEAEPLRAEQEVLYSAERSKRLGKFMETWKEYGGGREAFFKAKGEFSGELPKVDFETMESYINQDDVTDLFKMIMRSDKIRGYERATTADALEKILQAGGKQVPTYNELRLLNRVFGDEFTDAVLNNRSGFQKALVEAQSLVNVPKALMASVDLSAPLRQGAFLLPSHPKQWGGAFLSMFKQAASKKAFEEAQEEIAQRASYELMQKHKLSLTSVGGELLESEEAFMSKLSGKLPLVKGSERAYVGFLNKLRADVFDNFVKLGKETGEISDPKFLDAAAKFINYTTGRGDLGKLERIAPLLNATFFSPRLVTSRLGLLSPGFYAKLYKENPTVGKKAIKSLLMFTGTVVGALSLAKLAGAEVGDDPKSSDFAKIKIGNTRLEITGGFQQYIRLAAQLLTGKVVSSTTGRITTVGEGYKPLSRLEILGRGLSMKQSPATSFVTTLLSGRNFLGEEPDITEEVINRLIPMVVQDIYDLYQEDPDLLPLGAAAVFGVGVQTYGKQEARVSENAIGEPVVEPKPVPGLGEKLASFIKGEKEVTAKEPSPKGSATSWFNYLKQLSPEEAQKKFEYIEKTNKTLATNIKKEYKYQQTGAKPEDIALKNLGVADGQRAAAILEKMKKLPVEEREAYYAHLKDIGVVTKNVNGQIIKALRK